ncbi:MAG: rRNA maturation RNase YbeY [Terriglobales bacterium]
MVIVRAKVNRVDRRSLQRFLAKARRAAGVSGEVNVLIAGSAEMRRLNRTFRGKDRATDVLSFPASQNGGGGEVAVSAAMAASSASLLGHSTRKELEILILHGLLHLAGYDHEGDRGQMARQESRLRRALGLPAGLIERAHSSAGDPAKRRSRRRSGKS